MTEIKHKSYFRLNFKKVLLFVFCLLSPGKTVLFCMFVVRVLLSWLKEKWSDGPEMERHSSVSETLIVGDVVSSSHRDTGPTRAWNLIGV